MQTPSRLVLLLLMWMVAWSAAVDAGSSRSRCPALGDVQQINAIFFSNAEYQYYTTKEYFCSNEAPSTRRCKCTASETCHAAPSPFGDGVDIGVCGCCAAWVIVLLVILCLLALASVCVGIYFFCCQNRWWCDGAPKPHMYCMPSTGSAVIAPADAPLPSGLFRGYNSANFINYDPTNNTIQSTPTTMRSARTASRINATAVTPTGTTAPRSASPHHSSTGSPHARDRPRQASDATTAPPSSPRVAVAEDEVIALVRPVRQRRYTTEAPLEPVVPVRRASLVREPPAPQAPQPHSHSDDPLTPPEAAVDVTVEQDGASHPPASSRAPSLFPGVPAPPARAIGSVSAPSTFSAPHTPPEVGLLTRFAPSTGVNEDGNSTSGSRVNRRAPAPVASQRTASSTNSEVVDEARDSVQTRLSHSNMGSDVFSPRHEL